MREFPETNLSLIARVHNPDDHIAWTEFLGIYQPVVFRMARRRGLQDADAHDVMQQIFLSIAKSIDGWISAEDGPPFRAWLTTVSRNAINKQLTRRPRDTATGTDSVMDLLNSQPDQAETSAEMLAEARREIVRWAAEQIRAEFSESTWSAFWQTAIEGVSIPEVAKASKRSTGAIYVARFRVTSRLKEKIQEVSQHWHLDVSGP